MEEIYTAIINNAGKVIKLRINKEIYSVVLVLPNVENSLSFPVLLHDLQDFKMFQYPPLPNKKDFCSAGWKIDKDPEVCKVVNLHYPNDRLLFAYYITEKALNDLFKMLLINCLGFYNSKLTIELINYKRDSRMVKIR